MIIVESYIEWLHHLRASLTYWVIKYSWPWNFHLCWIGNIITLQCYYENTMKKQKHINTFISYNILDIYKYYYHILVKIVCATVEIQYNYILLKNFIWRTKEILLGKETLSGRVLPYKNLKSNTIILRL